MGVLLMLYILDILENAKKYFEIYHNTFTPN